ncbi:MAG: DUF4382 domain-containing protein [Gammaproteobacteria bacterium]|nr:DUF4382 domain-containing protein [Gammaproteobacteria bacterium]
MLAVKNLGRFYAWVGIFLFAASLTACAPTTTPTSNDAGAVVISLTDKPGDFAQYTVTVSDLTLTHANGAIVHTIAQPVAVDFSQYVQMSEFLTSLAVPNGRYTQASMVLDYTHANIQVEDGAGKPVTLTAAQIVDKDGKALTTLTVDVQLDGPTALTIAPGLLHHLHLDFDLAATNKVTLDADNVPTAVTVEPLLIAEVNPRQFKPHRIRGLLENVDVAQHSFTMEMRPFMAALAKIKHVRRDRDDKKLYGDITVETDAKTTFNIDGKEVVNAEGLGALAKLARPARVVVKGLPRFSPFHFMATAVVADTIEQNSIHDVVEGTVIKRVGNALTVRGEVEDHDGDVWLGHDFTVNLDDHSVVKVGRGAIPAATIGDISVGHHLHVAGALSADQKTFTATKVHLQVSWAAGTLSGVSNAIATLNVVRINGVNIAAYDFAGTGKDTDHDAKGNAYTVNLGALTPPSVGAAMRVIGMPVPFASADTFAFQAVTAIDLRNVPTLEEIQWKVSAATNIVVANDHASFATSVGAEDKFSLNQGGIKTTPVIPPTVVAAASTPTTFLIIQPGNTAVYHEFSAFATELAKRVGDGAKVKGLRAIGSYDAVQSQIAVHWASVALERIPKIK